MAGWSAPTFGSSIDSTSSWSALTFGSTTTTGSTPSWSAPTFGSTMGSTSSSSALSFGTTLGFSSSAPGFGKPMSFCYPPVHSPWGSHMPSSFTSFGSTTWPHSWTAPACESTQPSAFGQSYGVSEKGSRVCAFTQTTDASDAYDPTKFLQSISAMPVYQNKSHEELRHEDYQRGDKGGDNLQKTIVTSAPVPIHASSSLAIPGDLSSSDPPCSLKPQMHSRFPFSAAVEQPPAELQSSTQGLSYTSNPFWLPSTGVTGPLSSSFLSAKLQSQNHNGTTNSFSNPFLPSKLEPAATRSSPLFSTTPEHGDAHGRTFFGTTAQTAPATASSTKATTAAFGPSLFPVAPAFGPSLFSPYAGSTHAPSTACQENVPRNSVAYKPSTNTSSTKNLFGQNLFPTSIQSGGALFSSSLSHPTPAVSSDVQHTSINVDHPRKTIDLLLPIDINLVRIRFSSNRGTGSLVSQFSSAVHHDAIATATPISVSIYPGENQELTIKSTEKPAKSHTGKESSLTGVPHLNDQSVCNKVSNNAACPSSRPAENQKENSGDVYQTQRLSLVAPDCSVLPRIFKPDYYTVPSIVELAVRESDEPGYCSHVKDFTVGRHGYGSVKFDGETDVRKLDIASIVQFNDREILVHRDESKTPAVGQELNKPAEVTLLNVKCIDQKTGLQFTEGPTVDRYKDILVQWTKEHNAEFVSFDAAKGEWKFRVKHFK